MAEKSRDAFRTISEVADWLDVPTHVLRFWESRFSQIKPVKRAGGRRYYRPSDMRVIGGVKVLLHDQGMTIRGVQKLFREEGIKHVAGYAPDLFGDDIEEEVASALNEEALERAARPAPAARSTREAEPQPDVVPETVEGEQPELPMESEEVSAAPMFRRTAAAPKEQPAAAAAPEEKPVEAAAPDAPAPAPPKPAIPATPDVPATDAADDEADFARPAGIAARLKLMAPEALVAHREVIAPAAERLRALAERLG